METSYKRRQHVAVFGMVVVVGSIEVCGHHADIVGAVLPVEEFAILKAADFGQRIGLVGLLERAREQASFGHWLGCQTRIDARRSEEFQLLAAVLPSRVDHIHLENHILVHKVRQSRLVSHYAAHLRRRQENVFGPLFSKELLHLLLPCQIKLLMGPCDDIRISLPLQLAHNGASHHPAMPRNVNFAVLIHRYVPLNTIS